MREIKYRQAVFDPYGKFLRWHYWGYIEDGFRGPIRVRERVKESQQCTAKRDKNGTELYEGDIIKAHHPDDKYFMEGFVEYCEEEAAFILNDNDCITMPLLYSDENEIIGNIYENPELLAEASDEQD